MRSPVPEYRADIDGLRAVAVVATVLYHAKVKPFTGGFVGVDMFFVISGYLIGRAVSIELLAGTFSFTRFYGRRLRRLLPAWLLVSLVTSFVAYFTLLGPELVRYAKSLLASLMALANVYFHSQAGYFAGPSETNPLLHTWSLSVEEQFYLCFPLTMAWAFRAGLDRGRTIVKWVAVAALAVGAVATWADPDTAFFLPHARAWEFLVGTLLAVEAVPSLTRSPRWMRETLAALGASAILYAMVTYSKATVFPGLAALLPCIGTALIMASSATDPSELKPTCIQRALTWRPVVFLGLISYSLYLWHWPVLAFQSLWLGPNTGSGTRLQTAAALLLSVGLAFLSWKFVETPFRSALRVPLKWAAPLGISMAGAAAAFGLIALLTAGFPGRFPEAANRMASYLERDSDDLHSRARSCFLTGKLRMSDMDLAACLRPRTGARNYLLLGDSHAAHLWYGISQALPRIEVLQATAPRCIPAAADRDRKPGACQDLMRYVFNDYLEANRIDQVLLAARWAPENLPVLTRTLEHLRARGIPAVVFGRINEYKLPLPRLLALSITRPDASRYLASQRRTDLGELESRLREIATLGGASYISLYDAVCPAGACQYLVGDVPLQFDYGHLTPEGSRMIAGQLATQGLLH